jgi:hypothetical protein
MFTVVPYASRNQPHSEQLNGATALQNCQNFFEFLRPIRKLRSASEMSDVAGL